MNIRLNSGEEIPVGHLVSTMDALRGMLLSGDQQLVEHLCDLANGRVIPKESEARLRAWPLLVDRRTGRPFAYVKTILDLALRRGEQGIVLVDVHSETPDSWEKLRGHRSQQNDRLREILEGNEVPGEE